MTKRTSMFSPSREFFALIVAIVVSAVLIQTNDAPQMIRVRAQVESVVKVMLSPFRFIPHAVKLWKENEILRRQAMALSQENAMLKEAFLEKVQENVPDQEEELEETDEEESSETVEEE